MEYDKTDYPLETDDGYSDRQADLDNEMQSGGWRNLRKLQAYQNRSRQDKLFIIYETVYNNIYQLINEYIESLNDGIEKEEILTEIQKLRIIQDIILNCILWEPKGLLEKDMVPQEVWELIQ